MEEAVVKQGVLYLQLQQTFGKKWKKFWGVLYRDSSCSTARLELFEGSSPPALEKLRKGEGSKKLVKLSDCVHVAEVSSDASSCPKETTPFLLETTDKRFLLAAEGTEATTWIQQLCELAFPRSREEQAAGKDGQQTPLGTSSHFSMEENSLYSSRGKAGLEQAFEVTVRATESSERCQLWGQFLLRAGEEALELQHFQTLEVLYSWPYRFLRRFGRDKVTFSFEAGRRCASGEGSFEFDTPEGNEIFQAIESAISLHRGRAAEEPRPGGPGDDASWPPGHARNPSWAQGHQEAGGTKRPSREPSWEGKVPKAKPVTTPSSCPASGEPSGTFLSCRSADVPQAEHCTSLRRGNPQVPEQSWKQDPAARGAAESDYAVPFDSIAKTFMACQLGRLGQHPEEVSDPVYASIREAEGQEGSQPPPPPKPYHIYDEPEGLSPHGVYHEPQEVKGEAWKLQAAPEEPTGHQCPYNPQRDDYAVPKKPVPLRQPFLLRGKEWLGDADYDNVALKLAKKRNLQ
ncbi:docking protein 2 [Indicator indicator]|uniref:docking protein 2 n=1 Tax=Indicator indicator TaxID=1002788 RepID=UPI0023DF7182|nr:docking protein 2 [Indicator indicator]